MNASNSTSPQVSIAQRVARLEQLALSAQQLARMAQGTEEAETAASIANTLQNTVSLMQQGLAAEDDLEQLLMLLVASQHLDESLPYLDPPP